MLEVIDKVPYLPINKSIPCAPGPVILEGEVHELDEIEAEELGVHDDGSIAHCGWLTTNQNGSSLL